MTIKLEYGADETTEALSAIKATSMQIAAADFDARLRGVLKYDVWPSDWNCDRDDLVDKIRALHRACWEEAGVNWE